MLDVATRAGLDLLSVDTAVFLAVGIVVGLVFGVIPGVGGTTALAILLPLTFGMEPSNALAMAGGIMGAVSMGGSIPAILINTPGQGPSAATCLDGYPLARQGRAAEAIGASAAASSLGGLIGIGTLLLVLPIAKQLVLIFGPPEFFLLAMLGLTTIATSIRSHLLRGLIAGGLGLMLASIGDDPVSGTVRFGFGTYLLVDGIPIVPALVGLFAISEMILFSARGGRVAPGPAQLSFAAVLTGFRATIQHFRIVIRGSLVGTIIGVVPGVGGTVAAFLAYSLTVQSDPHPETFGQGRIEGVIAPEAANNAKDGGDLVPTLALGIPGSAEMVAFLGILVMHGMQPGPMLLLRHEEEIYVLVLALTASSVLASVLGVLFVRWLALVTSVKGEILGPAVIAVSLVGAFCANGNAGDVVIAGVLGIAGYMMTRFGYPRLPLVIALILGEIAERSFRQSMMISDGEWLVFVHSPASSILVILIIASLTWPLARILGNRQGTEKKAESKNVNLSPISLVACLPSLMLMLVTSAYLLIAYSNLSEDSRQMPLMIGYFTLALLALDLVLHTRGRMPGNAEQLMIHAELGSRNGRGALMRTEFFAVLWISGFVAIVWLFGFLFAIPAYLLGSIWLQGKEPLRTAAAVTILFSLAIWLIFEQALSYRLYEGSLLG